MQSKILVFLSGLCIGFACGFAAFRFADEEGKPAPAVESRPESPAPQRPAPTRSANAMELEEFMRLVADGDFAAIRARGEELFKPETSIPNARTLLAPYEVNSFPPYSVYALYTGGGEDMARRILLTMDDTDEVVSFLAEEMRVVGNSPER